jgi:hypothetical protein
MSTNRGLRPLDPIFDPSKRLGAISTGNSPGSGGLGDPVFSWRGAVSAPGISPPWPVTQTKTLTGFFIVQADGDDVLDIDILVSGAVIDSVTTAATRSQVLTISVPVVIGDDIQLDLTDEGGGGAVNVGVALT